MPLLLIGSALPGLWTVGRYVLRQHQWLIRNTANERRVRYYDWLLPEDIMLNPGWHSLSRAGTHLVMHENECYTLQVTSCRFGMPYPEVFNLQLATCNLFSKQMKEIANG
jgi:hypothetical protein